MYSALTRKVGSSFIHCALSFVERRPIDLELAMHQHDAYEDTLSRLGVRVLSLPAKPDQPDSVFVEDAAVVVDELAVMAIPALPSRRPEVATVAAALARYRARRFITGSALLEGGDVLRIGRRLYVGLSARTNREGVAQLASFLRPIGYEVRPVVFEGCLHLKTACTYLGRNTVLANRAWVDTAQLEGLQVIEVDPTEPGAGNALEVDGVIVFPASFPRTRERIEARGFQVVAVDVSELQKAEAGVSCCSILFAARRIDTSVDAPHPRPSKRFRPGNA